MMEEIRLPIRKLPKNTSLYSIIGHTKTKKLLCIGLKLNTMPSYYKTTSYNSSSNGIDSAIFISTLPTKKSFLFFMYL
jgi:hypothetical protein